MHQAVGYSTLRALAVSRKPIQDIEPFLEPLSRGVKLDLHLNVLVARVEEVMHLSRRHRGGLSGRQHHLARGHGIKADNAFFGLECFRVGAVPVCRVPSARRDGYGQEGVFAVGLSPVFFEGYPVFCYWCPDSSAGLVGHPRWDLSDIFRFDVAREFGIHTAMRG